MLQASDEQENIIADTPDVSIGDQPTAHSLLPSLNLPAGQRSLGAAIGVNANDILSSTE